MIRPLKTTITILSEEEKKNYKGMSFALLVREAVRAAVERHRELGLPNYYMKNGRLYGRLPNGRFVSTKKPNSN